MACGCALTVAASLRMIADTAAAEQRTVASAEIAATRFAARFTHRQPDMPNVMNRIVDTADAAAYAIHCAN